MSTRGQKKMKKVQTSKSVRAGITFPVVRILRKLRKGNYANHIRVGAAVYCSAVVEYLVAEMIELAGYAATNNKKKRIVPRYITLAIKNDSELDALLSSVTISEGGVLPHIHRVLLPKNSKKNRSITKASVSSDES